MILGMVMGKMMAATSMANPAYAMEGARGDEWQEALEDAGLWVIGQPASSTGFRSGGTGVNTTLQSS
jgi:hypothetical protein